MPQPPVTRGRTFRLFWVAEGTSKFGSAMTIVALPLIAAETLDVTPFVIGVLEAAVWLPWLFIGLFAGAWVDRTSRWRVMIASDLISAPALASVPAAAAFDLLTVWHLLVVAVILGVASVFYSTAYSAYLPTLFPATSLQEVNSRLMGTEKAAQVAGPGLGGLLARALAPVGVLLVNAATFLVSACCLLFLRRKEPHIAERSEQRDSTGVLQEISAGLRFVWMNRYLRALTVYAAASNLVAGALQAVLVVYLLRVVGLNAPEIGLVVGVLGVGGIVGALLAAPLSRCLGTARAIMVCEVGAMPFALLMPLTGHDKGLAYFVVGGMVVGAGVVAPNVIGATFMQTYCPPSMLGRVTASTRVVNFGTLPVGALLGGFLGTVVGLQTTMWIIAVSLVLSTLILVFSPIASIRDLPKRDADER